MSTVHHLPGRYLVVGREARDKLTSELQKAKDRGQPWEVRCLRVECREDPHHVTIFADCGSVSYGIRIPFDVGPEMKLDHSAWMNAFDQMATRDGTMGLR